MAWLKLACLFPAAAWGLQAFTASYCEPSRALPKGMKGSCTKIVPTTVLFIGQAHSGSTSLWELMDVHPKLHGNIKEHHYFDGNMKRDQKGSAKSLSEYRKQFCVPCNTSIGIDSTMEYINLGHPEYGGRKAVENIRSTLGHDLKIMLMVRHPVDLIFSAKCNHGSTSKRPFETNDPPNITQREISVTSPLKVWLDVFPNRKNWLFLRSEDFFADQQKVTNRVFKFLGIPMMNVVAMSKENTDSAGELVSQSGRRRCTMKATSKERKAYFSVEDNVNDQKALEKLTQLKLHWATS